MLSNAQETSDSTIPDVRFDPFRSPASEAAEEAVAEVIRQIEVYERYKKPRRRKRRATDQVIFEETVGAICADLIHRHLSTPRGWVAVSLSNQVLGRKSRYRAPAMGKTLSSVLDLMTALEMGFIEMSKGERSIYFEDEEGVHRLRGKLTTIRAGKKLISRIKAFNLDFSDLGRSDSEEVIILRAPKRGANAGGEWLEYQDTEETNRFREELREINSWLANADLLLDQDASESKIDIYRRRLLRVFNNGSFAQGGRLWGGFWMDLKKESRRRDLYINEDAVAELDYGQMAIRLLYGLESIKPPDGDLYGIPGFERHRDGVKTIINAALFAETTQTRMPQGARKHIPNRFRYAQVLAAIQSHHRPIAHHFFNGKGMELMFRESEVLVALLLEMKRREVTALPIHDSVLVPWSKREVAKAIMEEVFLDKAGCDAIVRMEEVP